MIVQTGPMRADVVARGLAPAQPPLDRLADGERLRHGERDGGVDADPAVGRPPRSRRSPASVAGILTMMFGASASNSTAWSTSASASRHSRGSVWIESRPSRPALARKASARAAPPPRPRAPRRPPSRARTPSPSGARRRTSGIRAASAGSVGAQRGQRDDRVAGGADGAPADRRRQLAGVRRVVPQPGRGRARHRQQRWLDVVAGGASVDMPDSCSRPRRVQAGRGGSAVPPPPGVPGGGGSHRCSSWDSSASSSPPAIWRRQLVRVTSERFLSSTDWPSLRMMKWLPTR